MSGAHIPAEPPTCFGDLFALERARLLELLATVEDDQWQLPTPCPAWDVLGLCLHLVGDDLGVVSWQRDGHRGAGPPPGSSPEEFIVWLDRLQLDWVTAARRISPRLAVELLVSTGPTIAAHMRTADATARTSNVSWAADEPVPVWLDHARELSEYWIHRQQLLDALGHPSDLRADLLVPVLDALRWAYPFRLDEAGGHPAGSAVIEVTGEGAACWHLAAGAEGWTFVDDPPGPRVAALTMTTEQAWRLLTNNLPPERQRDIVTVGDPVIVRTLLRTRAIIGTPNGPP